MPSAINPLPFSNPSNTFFSPFHSVSFCFCCATGDVATAAGKDYCCTCCLVPAFLPCIMPCYLNGDRAALAMRYNIADPLGGCGACCAFYAGCSTCLIVQELVEIEYQKRQGGQNQTVVITQQPQMVRFLASIFGGLFEQTPLAFLDVDYLGNFCGLFVTPSLTPSLPL